MKISEFLMEFKILLLLLDRVKLNEFFLNLKETSSYEQIVNELIVPALLDIGKMWEQGEVALAQIYMSGKICEEMIEKLFPKYSGSFKKYPKIGLAVLEDYHPLGMQIIKMYLNTVGVEVIEYELGILAEELERQVINDGIEVLLISTLMLRSALKIEKLIENLKKQRKEIFVIVGGAPFAFDNTLSKKVGADAMSLNAFEVLSIIKNLKKVEI